MTALVTTREIGVNRTTQGFSSRHGGRASGHHHYEEGPCVNWVGLCIARSGRASWWWVKSKAHLSIASSREDKADWSSLRWRSSLRAVRRPGGRWRLWERRVVHG